MPEAALLRAARSNAPSTLLVAPAEARAADKMEAALVEAGFAVRRGAADVLTVRLEPRTHARFAAAARTALTINELRGCRAVFAQPDDHGLDPAVLPRVRSLRALVARFESSWLLHLLEEGRFVSVFQPLTPASDPERVYGYESLVRGDGDDGELVGARAIFDAARDAELLHTVDRAARAATMRDAAHHGIEGALFLNVNPAAVFDGTDFVKDVHARTLEAGLAPEQVVLEIVESDAARDLHMLQDIVAGARARGYRVALDDFGSGFASLALLRRLEPEFVKVDAQFVRGVDADPYKQMLLVHLLELVHDVNAMAICEGIETPGELSWAAEHGANYLQGFALARPARVPPQPRQIADRMG